MRKVKANEKGHGKKLRFYVYGGNYPEQVVDRLVSRGNWNEGKENDCIEKCNLVWKPFNYNGDGQKKIEKRCALGKNNKGPFIFNHFEVLKGLVNKSGLVRSLKTYYMNND